MVVDDVARSGNPLGAAFASPNGADRGRDVRDEHDPFEERVSNGLAPRRRPDQLIHGRSARRRQDAARGRHCIRGHQRYAPRTGAAQVVGDLRAFLGRAHDRPANGVAEDRRDRRFEFRRNDESVEHEAARRRVVSHRDRDAIGIPVERTLSLPQTLQAAPAMNHHLANRRQVLVETP